MLSLTFFLASMSPAYAQTPSVLVRTAPVIEKDVTETLTAFGILAPDPDQVLSLSLPHAGLINRVWVRLGQRIKSGDRLLEVITAPDARMQYFQAQSAVDYARRVLDQKQRLLGEQLATQAQVDSAKKALNDAHATLEALRKRGLDIAKVTLRAPTDGIVTRLDVSQGQRVQANTTAMLMATEKRLIARLGVEPENLSAVRIGTAVSITSVFDPEVKLESTIREVHAMIDPRTHLVEVLAPITAEQIDHLILGSRILGRIYLTAHTALLVPRSAILGEAPESYLYTVDQNGKAQRVSVHTGVETGRLIEIGGALKRGDKVVISGNYELRDGMAVRKAP